MITISILGLLTLTVAIAAMSLRNLVHCALALTVAFAGLAALYLQLDAQFVGFAQILVYIGAVAILSPSWLVGITVAVVVFGVLAMTIVRSTVTNGDLPAAPQISVHQLGEQL